MNIIQKKIHIYYKDQGYYSEMMQKLQSMCCDIITRNTFDDSERIVLDSRNT